MAPASKIVRRLPGLVCLATMVSCLAPQQASVAETDQYGWNRSERVAVSFENTDTASLRTMDVVVRYGSNFSYDRLVLAVTTVTPAGYRWRDTVVVHVPDGHPGLGLYRDVSQAYRGVCLSRPGSYLFQFEPLMPGEEVEGVAAVGMDIY